MSFRSRLVIASSVVTVLTLGGAFTAVAFAVGRSQARGLDQALITEAKEEAEEASALGGSELAIIDGPGPYASDVGPLTRYAAIYGAAGAIRDATSTFHCGLPPLSAIPHPLGRPFDLACGREPLRGVLVALPKHPGSVLLLATSRADVEREAALLTRAMLIALAVASVWSILGTRWIIRTLTREHQAIAEVSRRVAAGDLSARVEIHASDRETIQLASDINEMIERLSMLMEAQQRFIASAAHELRSPLTTILGELSLALRRPRSAEEYRLAIEEALDSTRHLNMLADDLLALARLGAERDVDSADISVKPIIEQGARGARALAEEHRVNLDVAIGTDAIVHGRAHDLERLFRNLVDNAIRHSPRDGVVSLRTRPSPSTIEIVVTDAGQGVPAENRERIFEPFFRGSRDRAMTSAGAGLGLSIAREIARSHGGEVSYEPGTQGACFVVRLPIRS